MVKAGFVPDAGDFIWMTFDPQGGHEQVGRRPALVLSPKIYNGKSGFLMACPITTRAKGYPFEVPVPPDCGTSGVILVDQLKSVDWKVRRAEWAGRCPDDVVEEVRARLAPILGF